MIDLNDLRDNYPNWHIRRTVSGERIATRLDRCDLTDTELHAGLTMTLIENDWFVLDEELAKQKAIESSL
jgi:hypothetical protein